MNIERKIQSNDTRIQALQIALRFSLAFYVLKLVFELFRYSIWAKASKGLPINPRQLSIVEYLERYYSFHLQIVFFVICSILFASWMYRSYSNLGKFQRLKSSESIAAASWFIPLFSFFGPYLIYSEIVNGFEELLASQNYIRRDTRRKNVKNWWWLTWVVAQVAFAFSFGQEKSNFFYSALSTLLFLLSNVLILSSLNDTRMMEKGIGQLKHVEEIENSDIASEDII